jgi:predicted DNA binding CopG/RHH family protein
LTIADDLAQAFQDAADEGDLHSGSVARIPLDPEDISLARNLADKRGLRYQAYLKMLVHDALQSDEKKLSGASS